MPNHHGDFIWYELLTTDANAATRCCGSILGWGVAPSEPPDMDYRVFSAGTKHVADIDAAIAAINANGGKMLMEPMEFPSGEFAFQAMDPQGAAFALMGPRL